MYTTPEEEIRYLRSTPRCNHSHLPCSPFLFRCRPPNRIQDRKGDFDCRPFSPNFISQLIKMIEILSFTAEIKLPGEKSDPYVTFNDCLNSRMKSSPFLVQLLTTSICKQYSTVSAALMRISVILFAFAIQATKGRNPVILWGSIPRGSRCARFLICHVH